MLLMIFIILAIADWTYVAVVEFYVIAVDDPCDFYLAPGCLCLLANTLSMILSM